MPDGLTTSGGLPKTYPGLPETHPSPPKGRVNCQREMAERQPPSYKPFISTTLQPNTPTTITQTIHPDTLTTPQPIPHHLKWILPLGVAVVLFFVLHTFVITFFTVTSNDFRPVFTIGNKVMVNKLARKDFRSGDFLVYTDSVRSYLSRVEAMPGDTITCQGRRYCLPMRCCNRCGSPDCRFLLLNTGRQKLLVHQHLIVGKAHYVISFQHLFRPRAVVSEAQPPRPLPDRAP